jgi:hypothetical protein
MRLILLLVAVLFVGFLLEKQFNTGSSDTSFENSTGDSAVQAPKNKEDLQNLKKDLNKLMQNTADKRAGSAE